MSNPPDERSVPAGPSEFLEPTPLEEISEIVPSFSVTPAERSLSAAPAEVERDHALVEIDFRSAEAPPPFPFSRMSLFFLSFPFGLFFFFPDEHSIFERYARQEAPVFHTTTQAWQFAFLIKHREHFTARMVKDFGLMISYPCFSPSGWNAYPTLRRCFDRIQGIEYKEVTLVSARSGKPYTFRYNPIESVLQQFFNDPLIVDHLVEGPLMQWDHEKGTCDGSEIWTGALMQSHPWTTEYEIHFGPDLVCFPLSSAPLCSIMLSRLFTFMTSTYSAHCCFFLSFFLSAERFVLLGTVCVDRYSYLHWIRFFLCSNIRSVYDFFCLSWP
jgi:hypothetical protein